MDVHNLTVARVCLVIEQPLEKRVADARLARVGEPLLPVLVEDLPRTVDHDKLVLLDAAERLGAGQDAPSSGLFRALIRDHQDVRIHDGRLRHGVSPGIRFIAADVIATISPSSSPKKFSGQLMILPNWSMASVSR